MNGEKAIVLTPLTRQVDFNYSFEISGFGKSHDQGSILVKNATQEKIKEEVNQYVLGKIREFLQGKAIISHNHFVLNTSVELIRIYKPKNEHILLALKKPQGNWLINTKVKEPRIRRYRAIKLGLFLLVLICIVGLINKIIVEG